MKLTKYKFYLISLALVFVLALSAFFGLNTFTASASGTATASNVFRTSGDNVSLVASARDVQSQSSSSGSVKNYFLTYRFTNGEEEENSYGYYNNKLAYSWIEDTSTTEEKGHGAKMFSMEFGFDDVNFERFVITFESQQYLKTKDKKTLNYLMLFPAATGSVYALVTTDKDATADDVTAAPLDKDHIKLEFTGRSSGAYSLKIYNNENTNVLNYERVSQTVIEDSFENIGGSYSKSVTSGDTVYPLIFEAEFKEGAGEDASSAFVFYNLNGQDLAATSGTLNVDTGYYGMNGISDNQPPVLCFDNDFTYFTQGSNIKFDYVVIDVLRSAASGKVYYYVLDKDKAKSGGELESELFKEAGDKDVFETDYDAYLPMASDLTGKAFEPVYDAEGKKTDSLIAADMLVKAYVNIYDTTSTSNKEESDIYLDWYVDDKYTVTLNGTDYVAVAKDGLGARYNTDDANPSAWERIVDDYQREVDKAAEGLTAGKNEYFYLPSCENLFFDNATSYKDLKLSVYYYGKEQNNNSNLSPSNLSINVKASGTYTFTVYATDKAGNDMYYMDNGEIVEFAAGDIWDMFADKEGLYNKLPWFTFDVSSSGVKFEEDDDNKTGLQSTGYVGSPYDSVSFTVNTDDCDLSYRLFYFNRDEYYKDGNGTLSYEAFIAEMDALFADAATRKYFTEIISLENMEETDEEYEEFSKYEWSNASTSFTPQEAGFYYVLASARDDKYVSDPVTASRAVVVSEAAKSIKGESDWLKNNLTSVILLTVAALALIGIILLLVIKPKDKEDIDVRFEKKSKDKKNK